MTITTFDTASPIPARRPAAFPAWRSALATLVVLIAMIALGYWLRPAGGLTYQTPAWAVYIHLGTVIPALPLGAWVLWSSKGTPAHRMGGRIWALMMVITAIDSFWIRSLTGGIGPIHFFSVLTLYSIPRGIYYARTGQIARHISAMRGVYIGLIIAGVFSMAPGRLLGALVFG